MTELDGINHGASGCNGFQRLSKARGDHVCLLGRNGNDINNRIQQALSGTVIDHLGNGGITHRNGLNMTCGVYSCDFRCAARKLDIRGILILSKKQCRIITQQDIILFAHCSKEHHCSGPTAWCNVCRNRICRFCCTVSDICGIPVGSRCGSRSSCYCGTTSTMHFRIGRRKVDTLVR